MKALSIRQPWAWLIVHGYKDVENRTWSTKFRGEFLIHAGKTFDKEGYATMQATMLHIPMPSPSEFNRGGVVGKATLTDCVTEYVSDWFIGPYGFILEGAQPVEFRPLRGALGFFDVEETEGQPQ